VLRRKSACRNKSSILAQCKFVNGNHFFYNMTGTFVYDCNLSTGNTVGTMRKYRVIRNDCRGFNNLSVWNELDCRVDVCRIVKGAHVEHL
jgi:hypothetical protein